MARQGAEVHLVSTGTQYIIADNLPPFDEQPTATPKVPARQGAEVRLVSAATQYNLADLVPPCNWEPMGTPKVPTVQTSFSTTALLTSTARQEADPRTRTWSRDDMYGGRPSTAVETTSSHLEPVAAGTPGGTSGYLPNYLLGTPDTKCSPRPSERPPAGGTVSWADGTPTTPGPPTRSLFSEPLSSSGVQDSWCLSPKPAYSTLATSPKYTSILQESNSLNISGRQDTSLFSPEEKTSAESGETWVTVFGFPPATSSYMLQQFSQYGTIVKYKVSSEGNWMDLCYQSRLQAQKALSKNGKIFGQHTMVGVKPCDRPPHQHQATATAGEGATKENAAAMVGARPLVQAYRASASGRQVTLPEMPTPQRDTSVVSRALEYVFGW